MIKHRCSRLETLAMLATGVLAAAACGVYEDQPIPPEATAPTDLQTVHPELERVIRHLEQLDHRGLPKVAEGESPIAFGRSMGHWWSDRIFVAVGDGGEEVPPVNTRASVLMAVILNPANNEIQFALEHNVRRATAAHIHFAPGGLNGDVILVLNHRRTFSVGRARLSDENVSNLRLGRLYVNVHSRAHPDGEVRGQILRLGDTLYTAIMSAAEEVQDPRVVSDATGGFGVILNRERTAIFGEGAFFDLTTPSTVAHIHQGAAGTNGGIRFDLLIIPLGGQTANLILPDTNVRAADVALLDAAGFYVNVHSERFPAGEIRGQLTRK
jgi:hypothetical protein